MRDKLSPMLLTGPLMLTLIAAGVNAGDAHSGSLLTDTVGVSAIVEQYAISSVKNPLTFNIRGAVGSYRESKTAIYSLEVNTPVRVAFTASPLAYISDPQYTLDVTYWVNSEESTLKPGGTLAFIADYAGVQVLDYEIFGEVVIHEVSAQPAGEYSGTITVTVSALE